MRQAFQIIENMNALKQAAQDRIDAVNADKRLSEMAKEEREDQINEELHTALNELYQQVDPLIEAAVERDHEKRYAFTWPVKGLNDALLLIKTAAHVLPIEVANAIVEQYKGDYITLELLRDVSHESQCETCETSAREALNDFETYDEIAQELSDMAFYMTTSNGPVDLSDLKKRVYKYA